MAKAWEITGEDLEAWANRPDAASLLPKLLRRLLLASAPIRTIQMRADGGVRAGGWDGLVDAATEGLYCPAGISAWEVSVEKSSKSKLDADYDKRSLQPGGVEAALTTYVAVNLHRLSVTEKKAGQPTRFKQDWIQEKRRLRQWADVRMLDADDLATWLEHCPAVSFWLAGELGRSTDGLRDIESFTEAWRHRTEPAFSTKILLAGREIQTRITQTWLNRALEQELPLAVGNSRRQQAARPLIIRGESKEEAICFVAAAFLEMPELERERALSHTVVVDSLASFRWLVASQRRPLIVLPAFAEFQPQMLIANASLVLPRDPHDPPDREEIRLDWLARAAIVQLLIEAGVPAADAERKARDANGSIGALQRLCGYSELPIWARSVNREALYVMLMAGAWTPNNPSDAEILQLLGSAESAMDSLCTELKLSPEAPIERTQSRFGAGYWRWISRKDAWNALIHGVTRQCLSQFEVCARRVLEEVNPKLSLPKEDRIAAALYRKVLKYSEALRAGIVEALALLALSDDVLRDIHGPLRGSLLAASIVRELLAPSWTAWASLDNHLPTLAEAAPSAFLEALQKSLQQGSDGVSRLLQEESTSWPAHTGLLWALETLAWSSTFAPRAALALATLAARDPGGKWGNRPVTSLQQILDPYSPQTNLTVEERLVLLEQIGNQEFEVSWKLALGMMPQMRIMSNSHRPQYREWSVPDPEKTATHEQYDQQIRGVMNWLLKRVGPSPERWVDLLESIYHCPPEYSLPVLSELEKRREQINDLNLLLWTALRHRLRLMRGAAPESKASKEIPYLERLYGNFAPQILLDRIKWLFAPAPEPEEWYTDFKVQEAKIAELRKDAILELWKEENHWQLLAELCTSTDYPFSLANTIASLPIASEVETCLTSAPSFGSYENIGACFLAIRWSQLPLSDRINAYRSMFSRRAGDLVKILLSTQPDSEIWDFLDEVGEPIRGEYWQKVGAIYGERAASQQERAVRHLLAQGRVELAIQTAAWAKPVAGVLAMSVLEHAKATLGKPKSPLLADTMLHHYVQILFSGIYSEIGRGSEVIDRKRLFDLEGAFWPLLQHAGFQPKLLTEALSSNGELFAELVSWLYKKPNEPFAEAEALEAKKKRARAAHDFLEAWHAVPGSELPAVDREEYLYKWAVAVFRELRRLGIAESGASQVAEVLERAPAGDDGTWPCIAARRLLSEGYTELNDALRIAAFNARGPTSRAVGDGGDQERVLASGYRSGAESMRVTWPATATVLLALAERYEHLAAEYDAEARSIRREYGMPAQTARHLLEPMAFPPLPQAQAGAAPEPAAQIGGVRRLTLKEVGPAPALNLDLAQRLTVLVGDNSAGKTLLLNCLWWALTGEWPLDSYGSPQRPWAESSKVQDAAICVETDDGKQLISKIEDPVESIWTPLPGAGTKDLVIFFQIDGATAIWDPIRSQITSSKDKPTKALYFSQKQLFEGAQPCDGMVSDWISWKKRPDLRANFETLRRLLSTMKENGQNLEPGPEKKIGEKEIPTLQLPYGSVPIIYTSAAVKRVLSICYAILWAWIKHQHLCAQRRAEPVQKLVLLIDEVEAHLHPQWQRTILPAILDVIKHLSSYTKQVKPLDIQVVLTTHAPLILASLEMTFEPEFDKIWRLELDEETGKLREYEWPWRKRGSSRMWLLSDIFGLEQEQDRHPRASRVIKAALDWIAGRKDTLPKELSTRQEIEAELQQVLPEQDPFWPRWIGFNAKNLYDTNR